MSNPGLIGTLVGSVASEGTPGLPPGFSQTLRDADDRLPTTTPGLGLIADDGRAVFFPMSQLSAPRPVEVFGRRLRIVVDEEADPAHIVADDGRAAPRQIHARWYGFSYAYPQTAIYGRPASAATSALARSAP